MEQEARSGWSAPPRLQSAVQGAGSRKTLVYCDFADSFIHSRVLGDLFWYILMDF